MKENKKEGIMERIVSKILDAFFDKTKRNILLLVLCGFVLRLIAAVNRGVNPDDANHAIRVIGIFGSGKLVEYGQSAVLWYYIQGVFYKIFGETQLGSRFASVLFGTLLIILIYVFVKRVFKSKKAALISSFLIAFSPILIRMSLPEMDVAVSFFTILSAYFLFGYLEKRANKQIILSALFIGIAIMIKFYALFFAFSFIIFLAYKEYKFEKDIKKVIKKVLLFILILFILFIPTLTHNYLLYKDKGFMDLIFTTTLGIGKEKAAEFYSWTPPWNSESNFMSFFVGSNGGYPGFMVVPWMLFKADLLLFILGILGLVFTFKKNRDYFLFFLIVFIPLFFYGGGQPVYLMIKHFIWILVLIVPFAGSLVSKIKRIKIKYLLIIFLLFNLIYLGIPPNNEIYSKASFSQVMDFKEKNIADNALIVADSRIYRGSIHWALNGKSYIESSQFFELANELNKQGNPQNVEVFYIECVLDDCGWGTIKNQPEFNQSMEEITSWFSERAVYSESFEGPKEKGSYFPIIGEKQEIYRIYKLNLMLNPIIVEIGKQKSVWLLYPIGYDRRAGPIFDDYSVRGADIAIEKFAWLILYFGLVFSFFSIFYIIYLFLTDNEQDNNLETKPNSNTSPFLVK